MSDTPIITIRSCTRWVLFLVGIGWASSVVAQEDRGRLARRGDDGSYYDMALGIGFGIDRVNFDQRADSVGVTHFVANLRFNFWDDSDDGDFGPRMRRSALKAYLEGEVSYWKDSELSPFESDLFIGLNGIATMPTGPAEVFFGAGFGYHFFGGPSSLDAANPASDREIGGNLQFGIDINFTDNVALFGSGRYDILLGGVFDFQTKITGGVRLKF